jgi:ribosomal protein S14
LTEYKNYKPIIKCHTGNTALYTEENGGTLYIGGWNNGATFDWNTHVIDLTGTEHRYWDVPVAFDDQSKDFLPFLQQSYAGWLSLPFPDFQTPKGLNTRAQWNGITETIRKILKKGHDVLVACHGGHGRSGLFCAIVGYLLNIETDKSWASPVEQLRKLHCSEVVETYAQEKFVYDILGLRIAVSHVFYESDDAIAWGTIDNHFEKCPICGTSSMYTSKNGMCLGCQSKYALAPKRTDLTLKDIEHKGEVEHSCNIPNCMGIWKAETCGHVVHNMLVINGLCETCAEQHEQEVAFAEKKLADETDESGSICAVCGKTSAYSDMFGVCYECSKEVVNKADFVHNSITDPYRAVAHLCNDVSCTGIVVADVCGHVVHNREVEDGLCPKCLDEKKARNA